MKSLPLQDSGQRRYQARRQRRQILPQVPANPILLAGSGQAALVTGGKQGPQAVAGGPDALSLGSRKVLGMQVVPLQAFQMRLGSVIEVRYVPCVARILALPREAA